MTIEKTQTGCHATGGRIGAQAMRSMPWLAGILISALVGLPPGGYADEPGAEEEVSVPAGQEPGEAEATRAPSEGIEEITVTARKREESLQRTPLSVVAFGSDDLRNMTATRMDDVSRMVPNLNIQSGGLSHTNSRVFIRGIGQGDDQITLDQGVATYIDGLYLPRVQGNILNLLDIERIEVLRGPQGTLYGRNTIGGAVNVISSKPSGEWGGKGSVKVGNDNLLETRLSVDFPILSEQLAGRLTFATATRDGYTNNQFLGSRYDDNKVLAGRATVRWVPSEDVELLLAGDWLQQNQNPPGSECLLADNVLAGDPPTLFFFSELLGHDTTEKCLDSTRSSEYRFKHNGGPFHQQDDNNQWGTSATLIVDLTENLTLKSISGWRRVEWQKVTDIDHTEVPIFHNAHRKSVSDALSQEITLTGSSLEGRLSWVTGLYYSWERTDRPAWSVIGIFNRQTGRRRHTKNYSYAGFGQATYELHEKLSLTAGLRLTKERKDFRNRNYDETWTKEPGPENDISTNDRFSAWTPMVGISSQLTDDLMLYANWSRGFKSGGFNGRPNLDIQNTLDPYDEEKVSSLEVGLKSVWLDNRLLVNLAAFYNDYEDIQLVRSTSVFNSSTGEDEFLNLTENAGEATIRGVELKVQARPIPQLQIDTGFGVTDAGFDEFDEIDPESDPGNPVIIDKSDLDFAFTPTYTFNFSATYTVPFFGLGNLALRGDYLARSEIWNDVVNSERVKTGKHALVNGRIALELNDEKTEIALWGANLTDRRYIRAGFFVESFGVGGRYWAPPRTYGLEVTREF